MGQTPTELFCAFAGKASKAAIRASTVQTHSQKGPQTSRNPLQQNKILLATPVLQEPLLTTQKQVAK